MSLSQASEQFCMKLALKEIPPCWKLYPQNTWACLPCYWNYVATFRLLLIAPLQYSDNKGTAEKPIWTCVISPFCLNWFSRLKLIYIQCRDLIGSDDIKEIESSTAIAEMTMSISQTSQQLCLGLTLPTPPPCWKLYPPNTWVCLSSLLLEFLARF
jgi:hypothetical protein